MPTESNNDIFKWTDGTWIYRDEIETFNGLNSANKIEEATVLHEDTLAYNEFLAAN